MDTISPKRWFWHRFAQWLRVCAALTMLVGTLQDRPLSMWIVGLAYVVLLGTIAFQPSL